MNLNAFDFDPEMIAKELDHEQVMFSRGEAAYRERLNKTLQRRSASTTFGGRSLVSGMAADLADLITEEIARLEGGAVKRKPPELRTLKLLPARDMAACALRTFTDQCAGWNPDKNTVQRIGHAIGKDIEAEHLCRMFRKDQRPLFDAIVRRVEERTSSTEQRKKELLTALRNIDEQDSQLLTQTERIRLGQLLIVAMEALGIVKSSTIWQGRRQKKLLELSEEATKAFCGANEAASGMFPYLYPTVIPPRPWENTKSGGYYMNLIDRRGMVVARAGSNGIRKASAEEMPGVFGPLNYLQNTPWKINRKVYEVVTQMRKSNIPCSSLPPSCLEPFPAKPHDIETNEEARTHWRRLARGVHQRNAAAKGQMLAAAKTVLAAGEVLEEPNIYFPKVVDFRGRVYDVPAFLKPQGDDLSKGLLTFANGKRIGGSGMYWLAVHGANVYGEDKCSFDERVDWVEANEAKIKAAAQEPFSERFWLDADKPFQFLAFCFEWAGVMEQGEDFVSYLPVAMDGSCNGLQHLSALLRDSVGGAAVNLIPADRPQDIYTEVLHKAVEVLEERAKQGEPTAQKWLPLMKRKTVKRPVMTLPYGATRTGFADQIMEDTLRPLQKAGECPFDDAYAAAQYLGKIVWEATGQVVIAARAAMDWLQEVAKVVAKEQQAIEWATPSGFRVRQDYRKSNSRAVFLRAFGQSVKLMVADGYEDKVDKQKMSMAIAPNFVHSLDASHMLRAVEDLTQRRGFDIHLAMVHDSYATHAADTEDLRASIRASFVEMYQERCWLGELKHEVAQQIGPEAAEKLPPIPKRGDLQIDDVVNSLYFFG